MVPEDIFSWYEANLPLKERKVRGHFSTPPPLVERILDSCGYCPEYDLSQIRVLDPACGSGNFLAGVARRLLASAGRLNLDHAALLSAAQRNIWGFDPDPVACFLAEMQLRTILVDEPVVCENTGQAMSGADIEEDQLSLHIHQADGLAFPWGECEDVDLFLANPPYLAAKNSDLSCYSFAHRRGQADSYLLFLDLALRVVRPGGWIGLVLPDPVLARTNAARERRRLLKETTVHALWHLSGVFSAFVGAVVIVAQKSRPSSLHQICWSREKWAVGAGLAPALNEPAPTTSPQFISQSLLLQQTGAELRYLLSEVRGTLLERLHALRYEVLEADKRRNFAELGDLVAVRRGEELGKAHPSLLKTPPVDGQDWHPVLLGGIDVRPYASPLGHSWIARANICKPLERYLAPKLLVVKSTGYLQAALDLQGHVVLQTLYLLSLYPDGTEDDLYFLLALLNSRLLREYIYVLYTAYKWVQPQIEQHVLVHLPVPIIDIPERSQIIRQAKLLMHACSQQSSVVEFERHYKEMYEEQERAICALYTHAL
ncbi:MAG TPA: N-6 DNA methylase [Ktedonosporobacter sp.]|jgi:SAM-dependent methyltransferase|nr:N-6 DNA methylase [Ktedonosporobacter sp.]